MTAWLWLVVAGAGVLAWRMWEQRAAARRAELEALARRNLSAGQNLETENPGQGTKWNNRPAPCYWDAPDPWKRARCPKTSCARHGASPWDCPLPLEVVPGVRVVRASSFPVVLTAADTGADVVRVEIRQTAEPLSDLQGAGPAEPRILA